MNDLVADSLIRIKNAYAAQKTEVVLPYSKLIVSICTVLTREGYINSCKEATIGKKGNLKQIVATLRYDNRKPALSDVRRISRPGLRVYKGKNMIPYVFNGLGIAIVSTPKGVMSDKQARKEGVGGEVMAYVW